MSPDTFFVHQALDSLPSSCNSWNIYPENIFPRGDYLQTDFGKMHYWLLGPETGIKIVLIHGLSLPSLIWKHIAPGLASRGFYVLVYDLYGHGYTQAPEVDYATELYVNQLYFLLKHVGWEKVNLMGASMGGGIAVSFVDKHPEMVDENIILLASTGLLPAPQSIQDIPKPSRVSVFFTIPDPTIERLPAQSPNYTPDPPFSTLDDISQEIVRLQTTHLSGHNYAISSSIQHGPLHSLAPLFKSRGFQGKSVLMFHGTLDMVVPYRLATEMLSLFPPGIFRRKELYTIPGGPHGLTLGRPEIIDTVLEGVYKWFHFS
ncbi:hypothetical protein VKT23_014126 [Stygiomarasmius scandens]|uniref:AB hydrolase-1 domain-containing protein n=1 Tax=Marasmiellus scandens TaxID=2682957 RepID=A0ABR1J614_9AGAR